jgi:hypothetical protein
LQESLLIPKLRLELESKYAVCNGRIVSPGLYQNSEVFVPYFAGRIATGHGFPIDDVAYVAINVVEQRVYPELKGACGIGLHLGAGEPPHYVLYPTRQEFDDAVLLEMTGLLSQKM